ncbi:MAG TPA: twin-arginine translocase subunit TatC [Burkholderiales bacterium]|jgi:sec-independent protein translocase protein TatC|nr:twin-arginine translocase subunit TatC [Burkholderiales bacterium]
MSEEGLQETFISHLVELRDRLLKSVWAFLAVFLFLFFVWPHGAAIYDFLAEPLTKALPEGAKMIATSVISPFLVPMKVTAMVAFLVCLPWTLYQAWSFVAPGLYTHEKKIALPLVFSSSFLFLAGVAFCYYVVFGRFFAFINAWAPKSITPAPDIEAYLNFVLTMFIAFGVTFEVPVVVVVLCMFGIVTPEKLKEWRGYFVVVAFIVAAVVTPPDVVSQFALAVPMIILYELGLFFAKFVNKNAALRRAQADKESDSAAAGS